MFFIFGISPRVKEVGERTPVKVHSCGAFGGYQLYEQKTSLSLFFLPVFSWNKTYLAESTCCHRRYRVDPEAAKEYLAGRASGIPESALEPLGVYRDEKICPNCGKIMDIDDSYCSNCGTPLD